MKNILALAFGFITVATAAKAETDHLDCRSKTASGVSACYVSNPNVLDQAYDLTREVTIDYNFACGKSGVSNIYFKSDVDAGPVLEFGKAGRTVLRSKGKVAIEDSNPTRTSKFIFNVGCRLIVTGTYSKITDEGINTLTDQANAQIALADAYLNELTSMEAVRLWYDVYISGAITKATLENVIATLQARPDPISKNQVTLLNRIIAEGAALNLDGQIQTVKGQLVTTQTALTSINDRLITELGSGKEFIENKISEIGGRI